MNPFEQMQLKQSGFTAADRKVYEVVVNNIDAVLRGTATSLAEDFDISQPAITRFCKKLGYNGFSDFRIAMYQHHRSASMAETPSTAIDYYCKLLRLIPAAMEEVDIEGLAERILNSHLVTITGFHKSSLPARLLHLNLIKFGLATNYSSYDYIAPGGSMSSQDTLVIFSASSKIYKDTVEQLREKPEDKRPYIVLVSMNAKSSLKAKVDQFIWLPNYQNQNYSQYLESQVVFMVFVDLLTSVIAQKYAKDKSKK